MNKYALSILIKKNDSVFYSRFENVIVETDLELNVTEDFIQTFPTNLDRVLEFVDVQLGLVEQIVGCKVEQYIEPKIQKITFDDKQKFFRLPEKYDVFQVTATEFLICCFEYQYMFNKQKNTIKKMKMNYPNPEDSFVKIVRENFIPNDVKYFE